MKQNADDKAFEIVSTGYDRLAERYATERERFDNQEELEEFCSGLPSSARILDVGCGPGIPVARHLVQQGFDLVGIDLSQKMVAAAKRNLPGATILQMNMTAIDLPPESFDGLISCFAIFHTPREQHGAIFRSFHTILKPGGRMLVSLGSCEWEEIDDYLGVDMFWSHYSPETTEALIRAAGFEIEFGRHIQSGDERHYWVLAHKR